MNDKPPEDAFDVIIAGAGPAGLLAAISASQAGARVVVCDAKDQPGVKLLATAGGKCNLTNTAEPEAFMAAFGRQGRFMADALRVLSQEGLRSLLADLGEPSEAVNGFHVYPVSQSAARVRDAMWKRCESLGAVFRLGTRLTGLWIEAGQLKGVVGVGGTAYRLLRSAHFETSQGACRPWGSFACKLSPDDACAPDTRLAGRAVILCTGGLSYPALGATGDGYALARQAGHEIVTPVPALTPLIIRQQWLAACAGVSITPGRVWIDLPGQPREGITGDVMISHTGLSGPAVLRISGEVSALLHERDGDVPIRLCLTPSVSADQWMEQMDRWQREDGAKPVQALLSLVGRTTPAGGATGADSGGGVIAQSLARALCEAIGLDGQTPAARLPAERRRALAEAITALPLTVSATEGFERAFVTRGGVKLSQVDPRTMQSRLLPGLFFAGELLDLTGPTGGYNLQWAFSSGYLAGLSAAKAV